MQACEFQGSSSLQESLKTDHSGVMVLEGEVGPFLEKFPYSIPVVLVLSQGAAEAYRTDQNIFGEYHVRPEPIMDSPDYKYFKIAETETDCLAYVRISNQGQVQTQGEKPSEWIDIDWAKQKLGLAIITGEEGKNTHSRFWAKTFICEQKNNPVI